MRNRRLVEWEKRLEKILNKLDRELEDKFGGEYKLHPSRPERGETANPSSDGLFNINAAFSAGYGSNYGRGYIVRVQMQTLQDVPGKVRAEMENRVADRLREELRQEFPDRKLDVKRDGNVFKIFGDLSLGKL
ncbi:MAG: hypothetical protein R6V03_03750 [Kiritimatiellia bacterium]